MASNYLQIAQEIGRYIQTAENCGRVHLFIRTITETSRLKELLFDEKQGRICGWIVTRESYKDDQLTNIDNVRVSTFVLRGYYSLEDSEESELRFQQWVDDVSGAFRPQDNLNGTCETIYPVQARVLSAVTIGDALCHYCELTLDVQELFGISIAPVGTPEDITAPGIILVSVVSKTKLDVMFDESVEQTTAETEANYWVMPGTIYPGSALRDATHLALVHLTFAADLPVGTNTLYVNAVQDTSKNHNACSNISAEFVIAADGEPLVGPTIEITSPDTMKIAEFVLTATVTWGDGVESDCFALGLVTESIGTNNGYLRGIWNGESFSFGDEENAISKFRAETVSLGAATFVAYAIDDNGMIDIAYKAIVVTE